MNFIKGNKIESVKSRQIFDSRGTPTVQAQVTLSNGVSAIASVPSGASTGIYEACELRDGGKEYKGKGVLKAVKNINNIISNHLVGMEVDCQHQIDDKMCYVDGSDNKSNIGANAILAVSLACAKAAAKNRGLELYQYLGGINAVTLPVPMMNILNGGAHAGNNIDIQEFMIMPVKAESFAHAMRIGVEIYHTLGSIIKDKSLSTSVGDEGGYAPNLGSDEQALELIVKAIKKAGYKPGEDVMLALDAATSEWYDNGDYVLPKKGVKMTQSEMIGHFVELCKKYPIISIEDPLGEEDFQGFTKMGKHMDNAIQIVGDDLFVTNEKRLRQGIECVSANAILIKPNQIGTLTETMKTVMLAKQNGYNTIISHRSGETEDTSIADIAVALNAGQIKTGAPARTDRVCKYNRLIYIEEQLGSAAKYGCEVINKRMVRISK